LIGRIRRFLRHHAIARVNEYVRNRDLGAVFSVLRKRGIAGSALMIGSNSGQEVPFLGRFFGEIHLVDPLIPQLTMHPACSRGNVHLHPVALSCTPGTRRFFLASNNGESSSLRRPTQHLTEFPDISFEAGEVQAQRLAELECFPRASMMLLDVQGNEMDVLRSADPIGFGHLSVIVCEYSLVPLYEGSGVLEDINIFLTTAGFTLAFTTSPYLSDTDCVGDAVFVRRGFFAPVNPVAEPR
jgi:FkbM family methyltransferase